MADPGVYQARILERYRAPRHRGGVEDGVRAHRVNPLCGDEVEVRLRVVGGRVEAAAFDGVGCAVSQAAADLLCGHWVGLPVAEVAAMGLPDVLGLLGGPVSPSRERCAVLALEAAQAALEGSRPPPKSA